jgi:hypothetical protein
MMQPDPIDESIRQLSALGMSTRQMGRRLQVAQSTIVRRRQKINTGPNPILPDEYRPPRHRPALPPSAALAIALILLAVVAVTLVLYRLHPATAKLPQVTACVRYDARTGDVTGFTAGGGCPPGWKTVTLIPGG